jgi:Rhs element Vgr protein
MALSTKVKIEIDGQELSNFIHFEVQQRLSSHHLFEIIYRMDLLEGEDGYFLDKSKNFIGSEIKITIETRMSKRKGSFFFRGIITEVTSNREFDSGGDVIILRGASPDIILNDNPHCQSYTDMSVQQIANEILKNYPSNMIKARIKPRDGSPAPYTVQYKENSFEFLRRLCAKKGEWFYYDGNELCIGEEPADDEDIQCVQGFDLTDFDVSMKLEPLGFKYLSYGYIAANKFEGSSSGQNVTDGLNELGKFAHDKSVDTFSFEGSSLYNNPLQENSEQQHLDKRVKGEKGSRATSLTYGSGVSENLDVALGKVIDIKSMKRDKKGTVDYGKYIVTSINHYCSGDGSYENNFTVVPSSTKYPPESGPNAIPLCETQSAVVTDLNDPEQLGRVKVRFHWMSSTEETPWLRIVTPYAGKDQGFYFIPELDDEVLVAFESGNAEKPYIAGSHFNGRKKPDAAWVGGDNNIKGIRTRGGHTIMLDDTDGSEKITIYDKGEKNVIILSSSEDKLTIESQGDLDIKAKNITMTAEQDFKVDASGKA